MFTYYNKKWYSSFYTISFDREFIVCNLFCTPVKRTNKMTTRRRCNTTGDTGDVVYTTWNEYYIHMFSKTATTFWQTSGVVAPICLRAFVCRPEYAQMYTQVTGIFRYIHMYMQNTLVYTSANEGACNVHMQEKKGIVTGIP